jgi:signal transduction histidine kinase
MNAMDALAKHTQQHEALRRLTEGLARELKLENLLDILVRGAMELAWADSGAVYEYDEGTARLNPAAFVQCGEWASERSLRTGQGPVGKAAKLRTGVRATGTLTPRRVGTHGHSAILAEPLLHGDRLLGVIALAREAAQPFGDDDQKNLALLATHAAVAMVNARLYQQLLTQRDQLRALSARAMSAKEDESKRIARELHDEIGQSLSSLLLRLGEIQKVESLQEAQGIAAEARDIAFHVLGEVRDLVRAIRPAVLDELGLVEALQRLAETFAAKTGLRVEICAPELEGKRLRLDIETALYRIVQEALTNVVKHASARTVSVVIVARAPSITLVVEDDGCGFTRAAHRRGAPAAATGLGLVGIEERAALLGGTARVESKLGSGTVVQVEIPLLTSAVREEGDDTSELHSPGESPRGAAGHPSR